MAGLVINLAIVALIVGTCYAHQGPIVHTDRGPIRGVVRQTVFRNQSFLSFTGIPYAKPPVGQLRFKAPQDVEAWRKVRDASSDGSVCPQLDPASGGMTGHEDCLTLNVYTPVTNLAKRSKKIATLIFLHGGSFMRGTKNRTFYGPDFLLEQNLIVITLNYRLSALGFGSMNTSEMPGNQGLKDQNMALRWISRNIAKFGGDPNNITLSGESAGASSVQLHMLSEMSRGLFQKSISQSGTPLNTQTPKDAEEAIIKLAAALGYSTTDKKEIYDKLMSASAADIVKAAESISSLANPFFQPIVENRGVSPESATFLSDCPVKKFASGDYTHMPHIIGRNDQEMLTFSQPMALLVYIVNSTVNGASSHFPEMLIRPEIADVLYNRVSEVSEETAVSLIDFASKVFFNAPIDVVQRDMARTNGHPVYYYDFTYVPEHAVHTVVYRVPRKGVGHADELPMIYYVPLVNPSTNLNDPDNKMAQIMTCYWGNFAKTGNPTPPGATDACSAVKWEDSRQQGRMMNLTSVPHMINRQFDTETESLELYTKTSAHRKTGCS